MKSLCTSASARCLVSPTSRMLRWNKGKLLTWFQRGAALRRWPLTDETAKLKEPTDATFNAIASKLMLLALVELQLSSDPHHDVELLEPPSTSNQPVEQVV